MAALAGKVAIVTGGASGLGQGIVEKFAAEGAHVVIADVNDEAGKAIAEHCGAAAWFHHADVADEADVDALVRAAVDRFGGLHVMVNNAGISSTMSKSFLRADLSDFHRVMSVNVLGVMLGTQAAARQMADNGGGHIINVSSIGGLQPGGGVMTYRASKAAVIHFTKSVATELAPLGISVNCIAPGGIPTPILASSVNGLPPEAVDKFIERTRAKMRADRPLPREGTPDDVAEGALYLATSATTTGAVLVIDGGTSAVAAGAAVKAVVPA
jgi:NAD(P)-dependent dehydrogenase (short-subunit alcohol dehydrogenase family)